MASIGAADRAIFLNYQENDLYEGLLNRDVAFFRRLASEVGAILNRLRPRTILCDAMEFYNPVHDLTVPITAPYARESRLFEIPLIYQREGLSDDYVIQRMPHEFRSLRLRLTGRETQAKTEAWQTIYTMLRDTITPLINGNFSDLTTQEEVAPWNGLLSTPGTGRLLRYEARASALRRSGEIQRKITYRGHFLPVAQALLSPVCEQIERGSRSQAR